MSEQQVTAWEQASNRYCDPAENQVSVLWYAGTSSNHVTQANMKYTATGAGLFHLVIETYYYQPVGITINLVTEYGQTTTVVLRQTVFSTAIYSLTQTIASEIVQQLSTQPTSNLGSSDMLLPTILVIAVLGALIVGVVVRSSRRRARTPTPAMEQGARSERFCISCGAKLSPDAKFCKKCGSAQN
jgi:ribosomal protein L40E